MRSVLIPLLIAGTILLAGCQASPPEDDGHASTTVNPSVSITEAPSTGETDQTLTVRFRVTTALEGGAEIPHVGLHWAAHSVASVDSQTTPAVYGNNSGVQMPATIPGTFTATLTFAEPGRYSMRAHAIADSRNYWSAEASIMVSEADGGGQQTVHTIAIGKDIKGSAADYDPTPKTIQVGDAVQWENLDSISHTATSQSGAPASFNTGTVQAGATSDPITFTVAGTYDYKCNFHAAMSGRLVVQA